MKDNISHTKILPYQPDWQKRFNAEKEILQNIFGDESIAIEHIGSTSVEGLSSKPIIDIAVIIGDHKRADKFVKPLAGAGYRYDSPSTERHFFVKGDPVEFHLSIAYSDRGGFWKRQILFRDYLRNHSEARDGYAKLKENLLRQNPSGTDGYLVGKSEFIQKILLMAEKAPSNK